MKFYDCFLKVIIAQSVAVLIVIFTLLTVKFWFKDTFKKAAEYYIANVLVDTDVNEVLK